MTDLEKKAMWNGFYDELDRIAMDAQVEKLAQDAFSKIARKLTSKARNKLSGGAFVFPEDRRYPIHDESHARNALARASGKAEEGKVRAAVHARYPGIGKEAGLKSWAAGKLHQMGKHVAQGAKAEVKEEAKRHKKKLIAAGLSIPAAAGVAGYVGGRQGAKDGQKKATIVKTAASKDDEAWSRPNDSVWEKHKGKIVGGSLALATAAGMGKHIHKHVYAPRPHDKPWAGPSYLRRWAAKVKVKRTNEPFVPKGAKDGKLHPIKDIHVHRRHAPMEHHSETVARKASGGAVAAAGRTAHADSKQVFHKIGPKPK